MPDFSKFFLFVVLALVVIVLVTDKPRPLAAAPLAGGTPTDENQTAEDQSLVSRGAGFANQPYYETVPPLALVSPRTGVQPMEGMA